MAPSSTGAVVLVRFPFSDLSSSTLRPAVVLADAGRGDYVLCQITSNRYADASAIELTNSDFDIGSLRRVSYARPGKLFTANDAIISTEIGVLRSDTHRRIVDAVIALLNAGLRP